VTRVLRPGKNRTRPHGDCRSSSTKWFPSGSEPEPANQLRGETAIALKRASACLERPVNTIDTW
jgi:hypothetical protein